MKRKIGVLSDTHGLLRSEVREKLADCDMIFHLGDIDDSKVLQQLRCIAPVHVVQGNADGEWARALPFTLDMEVDGVRIFMIHNKKQIQTDLAGFDLILYGHSHQYDEKVLNGQTWLNPGSCGPRRFHQPVTMAMLTIEDGEFYIEHIELPHGNQRAVEKTETEEEVSANLVKKYLPAMMKDMEKGMHMKQLAKKYHISDELSERICRIYVTHPGVTADGIMSRLGY